MKKLFVILVILLFASNIVLAQSEEEKATIVKVGDNLPSFNFELIKGQKTNITDYKGKLILINLFATWCPPCNEELPIMQKEIWEKYKDNKKFELLVFGREEGWDKLNTFKAQKGFTFSILPDVDRSIFSKFATGYIPRNFLIDENGKIIYESIGYSPVDFKKLENIISSHLDK